MKLEEELHNYPLEEILTTIRNMGYGIALIHNPEHNKWALGSARMTTISGDPKKRSYHIEVVSDDAFFDKVDDAVRDWIQKKIRKELEN
jgi:hypothetical protein